MKTTTAQAKTAAPNRTNEGNGGASAAPPAYGIDFLDRPGEPPNRTGLPDRLKAGVESLSGLSLDSVRVHYNSPKPAQLQALAYTQGTDIHVAPGQEKHLPHEAWHVVQQVQGRVKPTLQAKGVPINDDEGLEREADAMGTAALQHQPDARHSALAGANQLSFAVTQKCGQDLKDTKAPTTATATATATASSATATGATAATGGSGFLATEKESARPQVTFTVGRRQAFFSFAPATHAVYKINGTIYGLAGDFGGVDIAKDNGMHGATYSWAGHECLITVDEADQFHSMARNVARHMTYTLLTQNCYTPVVVALRDLFNRHNDNKDDELYPHLIGFLRSLGGDNLGAGQQGAKELVKKNQ